MTTAEHTLTHLACEITGRCNLKCVHCYADSSPAGTHGTMTAGDWCRVLDQAVELGVTDVQFIGGEPSLHPDLPELVRHALVLGLRVEVFTNLTHVTPTLWAVYSLPGVSLATSYYSDDPEQHDKITGRRSHTKTRGNIAEAVRRGIDVRAGVIDMGQRADQARADLTDLGVPSVGVDRLREIGRGVRDIGSSARQLCGACGLGTAMVGPDGTVKPCVMARWLAVGDVNTEPLATAVAGMGEARNTLAGQGMPLRPVEPCRPITTGENCYPYNCAPR